MALPDSMEASNRRFLQRKEHRHYQQPKKKQRGKPAENSARASYSSEPSKMTLHSQSVNTMNREGEYRNT